MRSIHLRAVAATLGLVLVATGCGRDNKASDKSSGTGTSSETSGGAFIDPAKDCKDYKPTVGVSGDTIKIAQVRPASGAYSIYDNVTKGMEKRVESINAKGGVKAGDGKSYKLELLKEDDAYSTAKTPGAVKKLVEQDGVFAFVGNIGTETSLSVRQYLNDACVPMIGIGSGSPMWGEAAKYPWYISGLPSYANEMHTFLQYLNKEKPEATIAILAQNDDFGDAYVKAVDKFISENKSKLKVVLKESYDPASGATTEAATVKSAASRADVFIVGIGGSQCSQTLKFMPADWKPMTYVSIPCSGKLSLALAGGKDEGVYTTQATLDPGAPSDQSNPKVQEFFKEAAAVGMPEAEMQNGIQAAGWGFVSLFATVLENSKEVTRAGVMNAAFSFNGLNYGLMRDGAKASTNGAKDPWVLEDLRVAQRVAGDWKEVAPLSDGNGHSGEYAG
jgi:branched-chain amino acid transport system substrate-binding protein